MGNGFEQYVANQIAGQSVYDVVTDPDKADAILTDQIGFRFEHQLDELYPPREKPVAEESEEDKESKEAGSGLGFPPTSSRFGFPRLGGGKECLPGGPPLAQSGLVDLLEAEEFLLQGAEPRGVESRGSARTGGGEIAPGVELELGSWNRRSRLGHPFNLTEALYGRRRRRSRRGAGGRLFSDGTGLTISILPLK